MATKKISARKLPKSLTDDKQVISSMKAIQRAGFWAFVIAVFTPLLFLLYSYGLFVQGESTPFSTTIIFLLITCYLGYSSHKLNRLEGNVVVMIVGNILIGLFLMMGVLPLLLIAMSVIALIKIRPYKEWHKGIIDVS